MGAQRQEGIGVTGGCEQPHVVPETLVWPLQVLLTTEPSLQPVLWFLRVRVPRLLVSTEMVPVDSRRCLHGYLEDLPDAGTSAPG
jgi:hypothetical protein